MRCRQSSDRLNMLRSNLDFEHELLHLQVRTTPQMIHWCETGYGLRCLKSLEFRLEGPVCIMGWISVCIASIEYMNIYIYTYIYIAYIVYIYINIFIYSHVYICIYVVYMLTALLLELS